MELLKQYSYSLLFFVVLLKQLGLPIPATPVLILAGALAASDHISLGAALMATVAGCLIGDSIWYWLGKKKGRGILKILCHISLSPESCVRKTESSFLKYGMSSLFFAKFVPGLNTVAPPMAGLFNKDYFAFFWRDFCGSALYGLAYLMAGFIFEAAVFDITALLEGFGRTLFWLIIAGLAGYVLTKYINLKILQKLLFKERITVLELYERITAGEPILIVDIRSNVPNEEKTACIPGAIRIPPTELDQGLSLLDKRRWIVMYCT